MTMFDDPNREAVGLDPIWTETDDNVPTPPATGATAGTPGAFTPAGCETPADLAAMSTVTATPSTAWLTGRWVNLGDASKAYWDAVAWTVGTAP